MAILAGALEGALIGAAVGALVGLVVGVIKLIRQRRESAQRHPARKRRDPEDAAPRKRGRPGKRPRSEP